MNNMNDKKCEDCGVECDHLSHLNTCPKCVRKWINKYISH